MTWELHKSTHATWFESHALAVKFDTVASVFAGKPRSFGLARALLNGKAMKAARNYSLKLGLISFLGIGTACNVPPPGPGRAEAHTVVEPAASVAPVPAAPRAAVPAPAALAAATDPKRATDTLTVKRFVVATGVQDREPLTSADPLPANGSPIYAFAELANPRGESENVRITFERKAGKERVGDVSLPVPGNVTRHRTWAFTRNIFAAGVWEAVLWSENGAELSRTAFEVKPV
jgi:hypothetical protein